MPALALTSPSPAPLAKIEDEVRGGLPNHRGRLADAERSLAFYRGDFRRYLRQRGDAPADYEATGFARSSLFAQRVVNVLTKDLYKEGPRRTLARGHEAAAGWLAECYRANGVDGKFQRADALSVVADLAAFQAVPTTDPRCPVRLQLWDASQVVVWEDPDDQTRPVAVAVCDKYNEQRRVRLWTSEVYEAWLTEPLKPNQTAGGRDFERRARRPNDLGFIPFAFVHFVSPETDFWTPGIGGYLADVNAWVAHALTRTSESIEFNLRPILKTRNLPPGAGPPKPLKPGAVWHLSRDPEHETGDEPDADYLVADSSFVAASWDDIEKYLDHVADSTGTPKAALRMDVDALRSGASIAQEQAPLADWAKARQRPFTAYEDALAYLTLRVGAAHLGAQAFGEYAATAAQLEAAADDTTPLTVRWPVMRPALSGQDKDLHSGFLLDHRLTSRVELVKDEHGLTDEEAREHLRKIADDLKWERELFGALDGRQAQADADGMRPTGGAESPGPGPDDGEDDDEDDDADA